MQLFKLGIINLKYALYLKCQLAIFHINESPRKKTINTVFITTLTNLYLS